MTAWQLCSLSKPNGGRLKAREVCGTVVLKGEAGEGVWRYSGRSTLRYVPRSSPRIHHVAGGWCAMMITKPIFRALPDSTIRSMASELAYGSTHGGVAYPSLNHYYPHAAAVGGSAAASAASAAAAPANSAQQAFSPGTTNHYNPHQHQQQQHGHGAAGVSSGGSMEHHQHQQHQQPQHVGNGEYKSRLSPSLSSLPTFLHLLLDPLSLPSNLCTGFLLHLPSLQPPCQALALQ